MENYRGVKLANDRTVDILVHQNDLPDGTFYQLAHNSALGVDIETTGLDFHTCDIALVSIHDPDHDQTHLVRTQHGRTPQHVLQLLASRQVNKIFHHALFDLCFMIAAWNADPTMISCTKVESRFLDVRGEQNHSLQGLLARHLEIEIMKGQAQSNWFAEKLSADQLRYAAEDVAFLVLLHDVLSAKIHYRRLDEIVRGHMKHIPAKAKAEVKGFVNVFAY